MAKASEWAARVASWRASGLTSKEFCNRHGYSAGSLLWWSSQLRRKGADKLKREDVRLARVVRAPSTTSPSTAVLIELEGARVAVGSAASAETLRAVFEALRTRSAP
jgi:hypothetical protein